MSRDTWAGFGDSPLSLNRYSYVENNPCTRSDRSGRTPSSQVLSEVESEYNVGECLAGITGGYALAQAGILQIGAGLLLQGASVTLFGVTFGAATPVTAAGIAAGAFLEVTGFVTEVAAVSLVYKTCVDQ